MKANRLKWLLIFLCVNIVFQLPGQQREADRRLLAVLRAKAENGDAQSQYEFGVALDFGKLGTTKDYVEAVKWFRKAADQGLAEAQCGLGFCYINGAGVPKDLAEALKWYRKAAEQNFAQAQYDLGLCYANGEGVAKNHVEAYKWWTLSANQT